MSQAAASPTARMSRDLWLPRQALSLAAAKRRTDLVQLLRFFFTVGSVVSAGVLVGFVAAHSFTGAKMSLAPPSVGAVMLNPRFDGRDTTGRPYVITADTARRRHENPDIIDLVNPRMVDEAQTNVTAKEGVYSRGEQTLDLSRNVVLTEPNGYVFKAEKARMYVAEHRVEGATPLAGRGPVGAVKSDAYEVLDNGKHVVLTGNVWSTFDEKKK